MTARRKAPRLAPRKQESRRVPQANDYIVIESDRECKFPGTRGKVRRVEGEQALIEWQKIDICTWVSFDELRVSRRPSP
jgi:hypothetical protein